MFFSYLVHDVVEIEPVYLPRPRRAPHLHDDADAPAEATPDEGGPSAAPLVQQAPPGGFVSPVKRVFGSLEQLTSFLQAQEARGTAETSAGPPLRDEGQTVEEVGDDYAVGVADVVLHRLSERYVGRVLPSCGVCVAIRDIVELSAAEIRGASGSAWVGVVFDVCVLAPRPGTRLWARVRAHTPAGVYLSLMDLLAATLSVFVPASELMEGSRYDEDRRVWYLPFGESASPGGAAAAGAAVGPDTEEVDEERSPSGATASGRGGGDAVDFRNDYAIGDLVVCKVLQCTVKSESDVREAQSRQQQQQQLACGGAGTAGAPSVMARAGEAEGVGALVEVVASLAADGLGPIAWFEDTAEDEHGAP